MKYSVSMHMVYRFEQLIDVVLYPVLGEVMSTALNRVVEVHVHEFEDEG